MRLEGKVALISGGARGMGAVEARLFASEGAKVMIGDLLDEEGARLIEEIAQAGGDAIYTHLNVTSEDEWRMAVAAAVSRFGKLDVLVNNAGIWEEGTVEETTVDRWDRIMDVNAKGVFLGTKVAIPEMRRAGGGSIINISSTAGLIGTPRGTAYSASKGAVRLFTKTTAVQYGKDGIRANSVHPGVIETPMIEKIAAFHPGFRTVAMANNVLGRMGTAEDVAHGVLYLASDESRFVTGSELVIDGGLTAK